MVNGLTSLIICDRISKYITYSINSQLVENDQRHINKLFTTFTIK